MKTKQINKPIIGITLDHEAGGPGQYSKMPWYALRQNYCDAIDYFGAIPIPLPHEVAMVDDYLNLIDGLMITGGAFDVPPSFYGEKSAHPSVTTKDRRTQFEWAITKGAVDRKMPVLGICGGQQLLNVVLGGSLIQHIPDSIDDALEHEQKNPRTEPGHPVAIEPGTLLHQIVSRDTMHVNTAHHQAVALPAPGMIVNARSPDGVIEGIELKDHPFCLGVQWHPEYRVDPGDLQIFAAFVERCKHEI
ncbi:MAG: gamma-glutamyl-gamma-aminobutyrate hydrolase family protein [Rickettsiales bacterium]|nr:gamma-glutamyl-gamma-aminobutyrate hydrolase family protein [Rickettsiales bacterium]